jgi:M3 family oligoendopeptidase
MKFEEYVYTRPDFNQFKETTSHLNSLIQNPESPIEEVIGAFKTYYELVDECESNIVLCQIRHDINCLDEFYTTESNWLAENLPYYQAASASFASAILNSPHREVLETSFGKLVFKQAEIQNKTISEEVIPLLQQENVLNDEYSRIKGSAQILFNDNLYTLPQMQQFTQNKDRLIRKAGARAVAKFYEDHSSELEGIYDRLVHLRTDIAHKLGFKDFTQLGYYRLGRLDYTQSQVKNYRKQILADVVPIVNDLYARQAKRLNVDSFKHYDISYSFSTGNPTPKGDSKQLTKVATKMYSKISKQTKEFFNFMVDNNLLDLDSKNGKVPGGFCTYIPKYRSPFIFANFNHTSGDVDVLTHEAGHAFQAFRGRDLLSCYRNPTLEACEIHSMSMEFLAWPYVDEFFKEDGNKYRFHHLSSTIEFLVYGVSVDEFQHEVYAKPDLTSAQRRAIWRKVEKKYMPFRDYSEDPFLNTGTFWLRQGHIFSAPFYYIDYTLAQVCAYQFWSESQINYKKAWKRYLKLCDLGGTKSFTQLLKATKLKNPFKSGSIKEIIKPLQEYLDSIDDSSL